MTYRPTTIEVIYTRPDGSQVLYASMPYDEEKARRVALWYSDKPGFFVRCV